MKRQRDAALAVSGAHHSSWNGMTLTTPENEPSLRGEANWNGTIRYNEERINVPLREMYKPENYRRYNQDPETLREYRSALKTVLHENSHLFASEGKQYSDGMDAYQTPEVKALEEGITEAWSQDHLDEFIDEIGAEEVAPGIKKAEMRLSYPHYTPAARAFVDDVARQSGKSSAEVLTLLNNEPPNGKFRLAATLVYDGSDLSKQPGVDREAAINKIEASMKPPFAKLATLEKAKPELQRRQSALLGADAGRRAQRAVKDLGGRPGGPRIQSDRGLQRHTAQVDRAMQDQGQNGRPQAPQDLQQTAQLALGASPPLSGARNLGQDQFGSRRPGADTAPAAHRENVGPTRG